VKNRYRLSIPFLTICLLIISLNTAAGSIWFEPNRGNEIRLEAMKPSFKDADFTSMSLVWFLSGHFKVGNNLQLRADIPYAHVSEKNGSDSESNAGNPYVGLDVGRLDSGFSGEFGFRLPLVSDSSNLDAAIFGAMADYVDRLEAFYPDVLPVTMGASYRHQSPGGFGLRLRLAPVFWIDVGDALADGTELWLRYSGQVFFDTGTAAVGAGLSGRYFASDEGDRDFGQKSLHELGLFANLNLGRWQPTFRVRFPLDEDLKDMMDPSFVLSLGLSLP